MYDLFQCDTCSAISFAATDLRLPKMNITVNESKQSINEHIL
jgi:hypothetical protein